MVFPAAIREKSQRGFALSCDAHVVSAKSVGIRQPCTESLSETASCRTFLSVQHFCAGNSLLILTRLAGLLLSDFKKCDFISHLQSVFEFLPGTKFAEWRKGFKKWLLTHVQRVGSCKRVACGKEVNCRVRTRRGQMTVMIFGLFVEIP